MADRSENSTTEDMKDIEDDECESSASANDEPITSQSQSPVQTSESSQLSNANGVAITTSNEINGEENSVENFVSQVRDDDGENTSRKVSSEEKVNSSPCLNTQKSLQSAIEKNQCTPKNDNLLSPPIVMRKVPALEENLEQKQNPISSLVEPAELFRENFEKINANCPNGSTEASSNFLAKVRAGENRDYDDDDDDDDDDVEGKVTSETSLYDAETETVEASSSSSTFNHQANQTPDLQWDVYVCQSKPCKERGSAATLDAFQALSPGSVHIHPAYLHKTKAKGPNIRCIQKVSPFKAFEVNNVNDIDKVYRILTKHMGLGNKISVIARDSLKLTYTGNAYLEKNQLTEAIASYSAALDTGYDPQEGILLLLRATAYLKRAFEHQAQLRLVVQDLSESVPDPESLERLYQLAALHPSLSKSLFNKVLIDAKMQDRKFRKIKYRHGLYEYALLHAAQDSLRSTQLLPQHAKTWLRAGDALAELRKLKESTLYYQKAINLDPSLKDRLEPVIERLERSQTFLDKAKGWWSSDTLRLALDVAG